MSTPITWLCAFGSLNDAPTFCANSQWSSWPGTSCSSHHQTGSMFTCWVHHCIHSAFCMGEGSGLPASKFTGSCPPLLCQPETSPPHSRAPGGGAPVARKTLIPLLLPLPLTSWNCCIVHSQCAWLAGAFCRPCPSWHLTLGSLCLTWVPSPLQMSPAAFVK